MTINANFITNPFTPVAGVYNGLFFDTGGVSHASAGFITLKVKDKSQYSGSLSFEGDKVSFSGKFTASGDLIRTLSRSLKFGKSALTLTLALDWTGTTNRIKGTVSDSNWTSEVEALKAVMSNTKSVGRYTFLIPRDEATGYPTRAPGGIGSGAITNDGQGFAKVSLYTGDVDKLQKSTFKTSLSKDGEWPLYVPLYKSTTTYTNAALGSIIKTKKEYLGSVIGWVTFGNSNTAPRCAEFSWIKTTVQPNHLLAKPTNRVFYPSGFTNQVALRASPYVTPLASQRPIAFTSAQVVMSDGNLAEPVTNVTTAVLTNKVILSAFAINPSAAVQNNEMTISFNKKFGTFSGNFLRPGDGRKTDFFGALLQNTTNASGQFLGTDNSGSVIITGE